MTAISRAEDLPPLALRLDRPRGRLTRGDGRVFDAHAGWIVDPAPDLPDRYEPPGGEPASAPDALRWLARARPAAFRVPVGVIGPRDATRAQCELAESLGAGLADMGLAVLCGGRGGIMQAVCEGAARAGGVSIGLLPDGEAVAANPFVRYVIATGIGEARNALIARASLCLVAIGDSYGTLSEVALGRQFGKRVIILPGAPRVDGVIEVDDVAAALDAVARIALDLEPDARTTTAGG